MGWRTVEIKFRAFTNRVRGHEWSCSMKDEMICLIYLAFLLTAALSTKHATLSHSFQFSAGCGPHRAGTLETYIP